MKIIRNKIFKFEIQNKVSDVEVSKGFKIFVDYIRNEE